MKVVILARSLVRGGAERQIVMLARGLKQLGVDVSVVVFYKGGAFDADLAHAGIRLVAAGKAGRWDVLPFVARLVRVLRAERPDVVYGFMATQNLLTVALAPFLPGVRTVWGIRSARLSHRDYDWLSRLLVRLEAGLAKTPDLVIANSAAGARELKRRGFPSSRVVVVRNGIDVEKYRHNATERTRLRAAWNLKDEEFLVGIVARADPVKAHDVFLEAAALVCRSEPHARFLCVGVQEGPVTKRLRLRAAALGLQSRIQIEGPRDDLPSVYSAIDLLVMCSNSEGFPNVVAEAMSCGVPCAVTNCGDAVEIIGATGAHTEPKNPQGLAEAIKTMVKRLESEGEALRAAARARIVEHYSIAALATETVEAFKAAGIGVDVD